MDEKLSREELENAYKDAKIDISKKELNKIKKFMDIVGNGFLNMKNL